MSDVLDILEFDRENNATNDGNADNKRSKKKRVSELTFKRPEGMHRELYALLYSDKKDNPSLIPTDFHSRAQGYKQAKAKLGLKKVRPWRWIRFANPARKDGFQLSHWRRIVDEGKEYPFARLNTVVNIPAYNDAEYQQYLQTDGWTKAETDHLFDLCKRFDQRFVIIHDRWDRNTFPLRTMECLKDRYYNVCNALAKSRAPPGHEPKLKIFDAEHERKRKEQLIKLYDRTQEQVEEEQQLLSELRKIEQRKKEREKKTQDLQKLITAADNSTEARKAEQQVRLGARPGRKKATHLQRTPRDSGVSSISSTPNIESASIKFPEIKASGASLRSQRMKLPAAVGQKKTKAIEQLLNELNIELHPMPTEEICQHFNELRNDMVLLYELKMALSNCEYELQSLKHQYEASQPGKTLDIPTSLLPSTVSDTKSADGSPTTKKISEVIDLGSGPGTPNRKRRAALEQGNLMKKLKKN